LAKLPKRDDRTHAQRRRAEAQDALRLKFKGVQHITNIFKDAKKLEALEATVSKAKSTKENPNATATAIAKADCQTRILKVKLDTSFRCLKFVLPELKSLELTDPNGNNPLGTLAAALQEAVSGSGK